MQKVIFREEYDKYTEEWGFLAIFPEDEANRGAIEKRIEDTVQVVEKMMR